jgi:hypothetical protein
VNKKLQNILFSLAIFFLVVWLTPLGGILWRAVGLYFLRNQPIEFYGRIEDQYGVPVQDETFSANVWRGPFGKASTKYFKTDAQGKFEIKRIGGNQLWFDLSKPGYHVASTNTVANFYPLADPKIRHHPDPSHPVIFRLWKDQGPEDLIQYDRQFEMQPNLEPFFFDLVKGIATTNSGDLKISLFVNSDTSTNAEAEWSYLIEPIGGEIKEISVPESAITFEAPSEGYLSVFTNRLSAPHGKAELSSHEFFIKGRNGQIYTKVHIALRLERTRTRQPIGVFIRALVNPSASKNWETDSMKLFSPEAFEAKLAKPAK